MINVSKTAEQLIRSWLTVLFSKFLFVLQLAIIMFFSDSVNSTPYFQEISRLTLNELAQGVDLVTTQDGRYYLVATSGKNSSIQVYQQVETQQGESLKIKPVSMINKDHKSRQLLELSALLTLENSPGENKVYALSERHRKGSYGCLLSAFLLDINGTLTSQAELFINSSDSPPFQKTITGTQGYVFLSCQKKLVSIASYPNGSLIKKDATLLTNFNVYPASLIYFEQLQLLFLTFCSNVTATIHSLGHAYFNKNGILLDHGYLSGLPFQSSFHTVATSLPQFLLIYVYVFESQSGVIISVQAESRNTISPQDFHNIHLVDLIAGKSKQSLFYSTEEGGLGFLHVDVRGGISPPSDAGQVTAGYQKLALTNDSCQLLVMSKSDNNSKNGSLTLYHINDPTIGCGKPKDITLVEIVSATATGLIFFTVISGLAASYLCYKLKRRGAKKGYTPIGEPDY